MPNRILKESICESKKLSEVSFFAEDLYKRLITYADDYGRFNADYRIMLVRLYPREIQIVNESDIEDALIELAGAGKVAFYTDSAREDIYGCLPKWFEHQRVRESKKRAPDPDDTSVNDWYLKRFIPMWLKKQVIERDGFKCQECGKYICNTPTTADRLIKMGAGLYHLDHIVPVVQGGRATEENLRLLCPKCNLSRKKHFSTEEILHLTLNAANGSGFAESCGELPQVSARIQSNPNPNPNPESSASKTRARFVPPTLDEVKAYVAERKSNVDPQGFIDFYAAKGWLVGKTPMKDWKAACRNAEGWERWNHPAKVKSAPGGPYAPTKGASASDMERMAKYRREMEAKREQQS